ncbi:urea amidolyase associated protein UAAP1 [Hwanghaeella sp.]|uniref:urea amidolyase associated protein UAAP1 n=1 Tax=Hwanghaeella sp. TaxID=2605943 RepID=UPI003CCC1C23
MTAETASIDELKARYAALKETGQKEGEFEARLAGAPAAPVTIPENRISKQETVPGGWYWTTTVKRGQTLRIVNSHATPGIALQIWNQHDPSERFNSADTIKVQWTARIGKGRVLLSDMGRVLMAITEDTCGYHDCVAGHSTAITNEKSYGSGTLRNSPVPVRNSRDNFLIAAAKLGLGKRDVHQSFCAFAPVETGEEGALTWKDGALKAGDFIDLRAEMDCILCLSNCPHPLAPGGSYDPQPVAVTIWDAGPVAENDLCRTGTAEAVRAYENTDPLFD